MGGEGCYGNFKYIFISCCKFNIIIYCLYVYYIIDIKDGFRSVSSLILFYINYFLCLKVKEEKVFRKWKYFSLNWIIMYWGVCISLFFEIVLFSLFEVVLLK